ncbi:MAG: BtpA/SgcQ family protein [Thermomicrobiales bacterium]
MDEPSGQLPTITGVVHLDPLPGTVRGPHASALTATIDRASRDAWALAEGGVNALIVENFGDAPFKRNQVAPHTVAAMTLAVDAVMRETNLPVGVNVLRNDGKSAVSIAAMTAASFVRINVYVGAAITDQGFIQGNALDVQELIHKLGTRIDVWADIDVKHATQVASRPLEDLADDAISRGLARAVILTGTGTGNAVNIDELRRLRKNVARNRLVVGSGVDDKSIAAIMGLADGVIVGTYFKFDGVVCNRVDIERVRKLVLAAQNSS